MSHHQPFRQNRWNEAIRLERDLRRAIESGASNSVISRAYSRATNHRFGYPFANNLMERGHRAWFSIRDPARSEEREREEREMEERDMRERREAGARPRNNANTGPVLIHPGNRVEMQLRRAIERGNIERIEILQRAVALSRTRLPPNLNAQVRRILERPRNNRSPPRAPRAPAPNYSKTVKSVAKKFLMGPSRNVFLNKNGKPRNGNGPVNLNFNRGNYGIQYTRRWMSNGANKSVRFYYSVPTFERLVGAKWSSIRHKAPTHVVLKRIPHLPPPKKDERQTAVYRRNLALVKFI